MTATIVPAGARKLLQEPIAGKSPTIKRRWTYGTMPYGWVCGQWSRESTTPERAGSFQSGTGYSWAGTMKTEWIPKCVPQAFS